MSYVYYLFYIASGDKVAWWTPTDWFL